MLNWKTQPPTVDGRVLVKNLQGLDPFRIYDAFRRETKHGVEMHVPSEDLVLRGRDLTGLLFAAVAA